MRAVDAFALLAGKLDLRAGLDSDARGSAAEREQMAVFLVLNFPAEAIDELAHHRLDAIGAGVRHGSAGRGLDRDFFVFGADPPSLPRLRTGFKITDQVLFGVYQFTHNFDSSKRRPSPSGL